MNIVLVNEHNIEVPAWATVVSETGYPGAYDHLLYKDVEISTFEVDGDEPEIYTGPYAVDTEDGIVEVANLEAAKELIDRMELLKPQQSRGHQ